MGGRRVKIYDIYIERDEKSIICLKFIIKSSDKSHTFS
jgi:hypothetical protein